MCSFVAASTGSADAAGAADGRLRTDAESACSVLVGDAGVTVPPSPASTRLARPPQSTAVSVTDRRASVPTRTLALEIGATHEHDPSWPRTAGDLHFRRVSTDRRLRSAGLL